MQNCNYKCKSKNLEKHLSRLQIQIKKENEKVGHQKLGKVGSLENLGKFIPNFLISEFSTCSYS